MPRVPRRSRPKVRLALGMIFVVFLVCFSPALLSSRAQDAAPTTAPGYLYCPECGLELTWGDHPPPQPMYCPRCDPKKVAYKYAKTPPSRSILPTAGIDGPLFKILVGVVVVLGLAYLVLRYARSRHESLVAQSVFLFPCPCCRRDLKYTESMAGRPGLCGYCNTRCVYPETGQGPEDDYFRRKTLKKWGKQMTKLPRRKKAP
jgi:hypothetical protein